MDPIGSDRVQKKGSIGLEIGSIGLNINTMRGQSDWACCLRGLRMLKRALNRIENLKNEGHQPQNLPTMPKYGSTPPPWDWPPFLTFLDPVGFQFYIQLKCDFLPPPKKNLFVSVHLVPDIIGPKVALTFHQKLSFDIFEAFSTNLSFSIQLILFSLFLDPLHSKHAYTLYQ